MANDTFSIKSPYVRMMAEAVEYKWCWNLFCPFCHHMPFRYAFLEMASGVHPDSDVWEMSRWPMTRSHFFNKWGRIGQQPGLPHNWKLMEEKALAALMAEIDVVEMIEHISFPQFVYMLGLGLYYTERAEKSNFHISKSLAGQMLEKLTLTDDGKAFLQKKAAGKETLQWQEMEKLEEVLQAAMGNPSPGLEGAFLFTFHITLPGFLERHSRRKAIAEMLNQYDRQEQYKPEIYGYVFTTYAMYLVAKVNNRYSFCNSFLAHSSYLIEASLSSKEPKEVAQQVRQNGMWREHPVSKPLADKAAIEKALRSIENIPVENEYVARASDWLWSSACSKPPTDMILANIT